MKAYTVLGYANTTEGYALCLDCYHEFVDSPEAENSPSWWPIFAGDEGLSEYTCDHCLTRLDS